MSSKISLLRRSRGFSRRYWCNLKSGLGPNVTMPSGWINLQPFLNNISWDLCHIWWKISYTIIIWPDSVIQYNWSGLTWPCQYSSIFSDQWLSPNNGSCTFLSARLKDTWHSHGYCSLSKLYIFIKQQILGPKSNSKYLKKTKASR